jgi:hypothetical protein
MPRPNTNITLQLDTKIEAIHISKKGVRKKIMTIAQANELRNKGYDIKTYEIGFSQYGV